MEIFVRHAIVHELRKTINTAPEVFTRESVLPLTESVNRLFGELYSLYTRRSTKGLGYFDPDVNTYPFSMNFEEYLNFPMEDNFIGFTKKAMGHLKSRISEANLATGGYVLFFLCTNQNDEKLPYLFITLLRQTKGCVITQELEIDDATHLDLSNLHIGCQVSTYDWKNNEDNPYITFIKGASSAKTPDYFLRAIGCTEHTDSRVQTQEFIRALGDYAAQHKFTHEQRMSINQRVHEYCRNVRAINLLAVSAVANPEQPESFLEFANEGGYKFSEGLEPDKRILKNLREFSAKGEGIKLSCPAVMVGERVLLNENGGIPQIVINNPPESIVKAFREAK